MIASLLFSLSLLQPVPTECPPGLDLAIFPPSPASVAAPADTRVFTATGRAAPELDWVDSLLQGFMTSTGISRAAVAITKGERLVFSRGYTWAEPGTAATTPTTTFRIASCSKPITSLAIHRLIERGAIAYDTRAAERLDLLTRPGNFRDPRLDTIEVDDLLTHCGGWDRNTTWDPIIKDLEISRDLGVPLPISKHDVRTWMNGERLQFAPGERFAYSNYGVSLLGQMLEKATGLPFPEAIRELVFAPLGLSRPRVGHSHEEELFPGEAGYDDRHAYDFVNIEAWDAAGGWIAAAPDWARLFRVLDPSTGRDFLADETVASMLDERFALGELGVARGWFRWTTPDGARAFGHDGALPGTSTSAYWRSDDGVGIVIFLNRSVGSFPTIHQRIASQIDWPADDLWESVGIGPAAPSRSTSERWVAAATHAPGAAGSRWQSDLVVVNRALLPNQIRIESMGATSVATLGPGECRATRDFVGELGAEGTGPLRILAAEPVEVASRIYSTSADGTFGQSLDGEFPFEELWRGDSAWLPALREDEQARTNLGLLNTGRRSATIRLVAFDASGAQRLEQQVEVPPGELVTLLRPLAGAAPLEEASIRLDVLFGEWLTAYASVVDNRTNDPTTIPLLRPGGLTRFVVPVVARADGGHGSRWTSSLALLNPGPESAVATIRVAGRDLPPRAIEILPGAQETLDDVLALFVDAGIASLRVEATRPILALSRTWNDGETGSFGQSIPAIDPSELLGSHDSGLVAGLRSDADFRTNLFVGNFGAEPSRVLLRVGGCEDGPEGQAELAIEPDGLRMVPASDLVGAAELASGTATIEVLEGAGVAAWGSLVDNRTNDPTTLPMRR